MKVQIYVEGGGESKVLRIQCREGFRKLIQKAGFTGRMPGITACGGRQDAYDRFKTALIIPVADSYPVLLVDSEDPINPQLEEKYGTAVAWHHFKSRDNWDRPDNAKDNQAQMMVTCMETWIMSDRDAINTCFGTRLQPSALLPDSDLEKRSRGEVLRALEKATRACGPYKAYRKGRRSFQVLADLNPQALLKLKYFKRFVTDLRGLLGRQ